jgi:Flp pilus assembly protein TadG
MGRHRGHPLHALTRASRSVAIRYRLRDDRGSVLIFTTAMLVFLLVFVGLAVDLASYMVAQAEMRRTIDAASLAGAGGLRFDEAVFDKARADARLYAASNPVRMLIGPAAIIDLNPNPGNDPAGDIVLGMLNGSTFDPSAASSAPCRVNAVFCRKQAAVPTVFLRLLGIDSLTVSAESLSTSDPLVLPPEEGCWPRVDGVPQSRVTVPLGVSLCPFADCADGCGQRVAFIVMPSGPQSTNTAAWANIDGAGAPSSTATAGGFASSGTCRPVPFAPGIVGIGNTMDAVAIGAAWQALRDHVGGGHQIRNRTGTLVYSGSGWPTFVPAVGAGCGASPAGDLAISSWARVVITQVYDPNKPPADRCALNNPADVMAANFCADPGLATGAIFGFYDCGVQDAAEAPTGFPAFPVNTPELRTGLSVRNSIRR